MTNIVSRRAQIRLPTEAYADPTAVCCVTIGVKQRLRVFADEKMAAASIEILRRHARATSVRVWAFCFMPDHVHIVLSPSTSTNVVSFIGAFKSKVAVASWQLGVKGSFWQPRFWDHFVRSGAEAERQIRYVMENPVRAALVASSDNYPFAGLGDENGGI